MQNIGCFRSSSLKCENQEHYFKISNFNSIILKHDGYSDKKILNSKYPDTNRNLLDPPPNNSYIR